jgi:hypothetical protein
MDPGDGPTAEEAVDSLRELPKLWGDAKPDGRKLLAEALMDRIDVLGTGKVKLHPSASAKAQGWDRAWNGARLVVMVGARGFKTSISFLLAGGRAQPEGDETPRSEGVEERIA